MDASRYFDAMHNAMSTLHTGAQLLLTVRLQDTCGNDAYLEVKQLPGEQSALVCYSTMGRRCLNFQLFRKGWQLCHNADGQLTGRFPSSADSLLSQTDFRAYCREDRLDAACATLIAEHRRSHPRRRHDQNVSKEGCREQEAEFRDEKGGGKPPQEDRKHPAGREAEAGCSPEGGREGAGPRSARPGRGAGRLEHPDLYEEGDLRGEGTERRFFLYRCSLQCKILSAG